MSPSVRSRWSSGTVIVMVWLVTLAVNSTVVGNGSMSQWLPRRKSSGSSTRMLTVRAAVVSPPLRVKVKVAVPPSATDDGVPEMVTRALPLGGSLISMDAPRGLPMV